MTNERREEVVLVALTVSVMIHVGLMFLVRPQVLTHVSETRRRSRPVPMRVVKPVQEIEPLRREAVTDVQPRKDEPAARPETEIPTLDETVTALRENVKPDFDVSLPAAKMPELKSAFDTKPVGKQVQTSVSIPMVRIETPGIAPAESSAPVFSLAIPSAPWTPVAVPSIGKTPDAVFLPTHIERERKVQAAAEKAKTLPRVQEVFEKVDEKVVEAEKAEVRELVGAEDAAELSKFVNVSAMSNVEDGWRYFSILVVARQDLPVVPKDIALIIDGSGSIGNDRLTSCRKAARRILRTCTNSDDRFNLVVFRNRYSYAFRTWRPCDQRSFEEGDAWLSNQTAHGRTDVFSTISSVLTLPRDPRRPLIALVITDGDANEGVSDTAEILSKFTALNDGLVSVYMYGVKSSANRELIDVLTHGNRGEGFIYEGWRWKAGEKIDELSERFRDPVLSDLRIVFSADAQVESYPRQLRNIYRGGDLEIYGRVPASTKSVSFSLKGLNGENAFESFFTLSLDSVGEASDVASAWKSEKAIDAKLRESK